MSNYEQQKAKYEADLIEAQDIYFSVRPQLSRSYTEEKIFEGGFRLSREALQKSLIPESKPEI